MDGAKNYLELSLDEYISDRNLGDLSLKVQAPVHVPEREDVYSDMPALEKIPASVGISPLKRVVETSNRKRGSIFDRLGWRKRGIKNRTNQLQWYRHGRKHWVAKSWKTIAKQKKFCQVPGDLRMKIALSKLLKTTRRYKKELQDALPALQLLQNSSNLIAGLKTMRKKSNIFRLDSHSSMNSLASAFQNVNSTGIRIPPPVFGLSNSLFPEIQPSRAVSDCFGAHPFTQTGSRPTLHRSASLMSLGSTVLSEKADWRPVSVTVDNGVRYVPTPINRNVRDMPNLSSHHSRPEPYEQTYQTQRNLTLNSNDDGMPVLSRISDSVRLKAANFYGTDVQVHRDSTSMRLSNPGHSGIPVHTTGVPTSDHFAYLNRNAYGQV